MRGKDSPFFLDPLLSPADLKHESKRRCVVSSLPNDPLSPISPVSSDSELSSPASGDAADNVPSPKSDADPVSRPNFRLSTSSIDEDRPFKVVVIGAGFSGILAGIRFPQRMRNLDLTIYDKNSGVGGTWYSNRYPGVACDVPAHCYQPTFENKTDWSSFYSPGPEIRAECERIVEKYKLMRYIKLNHELVHAQYDEPNGKWELKLRRRKVDSPPDEREEFEVIEDTADFVVAGVGSLSRWAWPDIQGLSDYKGKLLHTAAWETDKSGWWHSSIANWGDKTVGVIGSGSTTTQVVPAIQPHVKHLYNYVRGRTWLSPPFHADTMAELLGRDTVADNHEFTEEEKLQFKDPVFFKQFRHAITQDMNSWHLTTIKGTPTQIAAQEAFREHMRSRLQKKAWIADHIMPDFSVTCRRLTPGPGYLEALQADNTDFVPTHIKLITESGVELVDGTRHDLDIIICATGYDTSYQYPFTVIGRGGVKLNERFTPHPETYISLCVDGFPNWFMSMGPNSVIGTGSMLLIIESQIEYAIAVAKKMQREHLKSVEPKKEAVRDFDDYLVAYFKTTTFSEPCRSWYKMGKADGRIVGLWPGSSLHAMKAFEHPRWEDYNYEFLDSVSTSGLGTGEPHRFYWLGDGSTYNEKYMTGDRAWYLNDIDIPPVPN